MTGVDNISSQLYDIKLVGSSSIGKVYTQFYSTYYYSWNKFDKNYTVVIYLKEMKKPGNVINGILESNWKNT